MRNLKSLITITIISTVLIGCESESPKDANKENFRNSLNRYFDNNCALISPSASFGLGGRTSSNFPETINLLPEDNPQSESRNPKTTEEYDVLVDVGLLKVETGTVQVDKLSFIATDEKITLPTKTYSLTEAGQESFRELTSRRSWGPSKGFCLATYKIDEISNFSEPSQMMGLTISSVNYSFHPSNIKDWATNQSVASIFPNISKLLQEKQKASADLILMNDGWVHEKEMKN